MSSAPFGGLQIGANDVWPSGASTLMVFTCQLAKQTEQMNSATATQETAFLAFIPQV